MRTRIKYSQNFLKNHGLIESLLSKSTITKDDVVLDIGAGEGIITQALLNHAKKVVAYEIDAELYRKLTERFGANGNTAEIIKADFLSMPLPRYPYKVFSNIPFNITSDVIKKLVFDNNPPEDIYLITQKEAAGKFLGKALTDKNSLMSVIIGNIFEGSVFHVFKKTDFFPIPTVNTIMIKLKRRPQPLAEPTGLFNDFIAFGFSQFEPNIQKGLEKLMSENLIIQTALSNNFTATLKPSQLDLNNWVTLFGTFLTSGNKKKVTGSFRDMLSQQSKLQKVHRTRVDKGWKKFIS